MRSYLRRITAVLLVVLVSGYATATHAATAVPMAVPVRQVYSELYYLKNGTYLKVGT